MDKLTVQLLNISVDMLKSGYIPKGFEGNNKILSPESIFATFKELRQQLDDTISVEGRN